MNNDTTLTLSNPWQHDEVIQIPDLSLDSMMYNNFIAVKVGDVNNTAKANALQVQPRADRRIVKVFVTDETEGESGDIIKVHFALPEYLEGFQWTLETNGLEYMGMESQSMVMDDANIALLREGLITMSWNDQINTAPDGQSRQDQSFTLVFHKTQEGQLKDILRMTSLVTDAEGYTATGEIIEPEMHFGTAQTPLEFALYQNEPNPWNGTTQVRFDLPEEGQVKFTVFDASGKVVYQKESFYKPGSHTLVINNKDIRTNGVFYYRVDCGKYSAAKKMIRMN